jgi:plastocyanin
MFGVAACGSDANSPAPTETVAAQAATSTTAPEATATIAATAGPAPTETAAHAPTQTVTPEPPTLTPEPPTFTPDPPTPVPPAPTQPPPAQAGGPGPVSLFLTAVNLDFSPATLVAASGAGVTIVLSNQDNLVPHNVSVSGVGTSATCQGPCSAMLSFTAPAPGSYAFLCSVHPFMTGTLIVQ